MKTIADAHKALSGELGNAVLPSISDEFLFYSESKGFFICYNSIDTGNFSGCQYICTVEEFNNYKGESMKTIDAVNEFKGNNILNWTHMSYDSSIKQWAVHIFKPEFSYAYTGDIICNKEEFNTLVQGCMTNFGRCSISFSEHCSNESARLQEDNKIDWSQAPEGCVGYSVSTASNHYWMFSCHQVPAPDFGFTEFKFHPKPQPKESNMKPVFTQEMSDNGELPSVGMELKYKVTGGVNWFKCKIIAFNEGYHRNDNYVWLENLTTGSIPLINLSGIIFKPLTPPINLEDGSAYQFEIHKGVFLGFYIKERDSFFYDIDTGNKICGASEASSIVKLIQEVK